MLHPTTEEVPPMPQPPRLVTLDARRRATLPYGRPGLYDAQEAADGTIRLTPVVAVPLRDVPKVRP